ncbi:MAG: ACT domain-containing protein [Clostridia bacterium]
MKDVLAEHSTVTHVYTDNQQAMVTVNNLPHDPFTIAQLFNEIANERINIDMISQTAPVDHRVDISFTLSISDLDKMNGILEEISHSNADMKVDINKGVTKLTVEGVGMERQVGVAAKLFSLMAEQDIRIESITTSETKISYLIDRADEKKALESIIQAFDL